MATASGRSARWKYKQTWQEQQRRRCGQRAASPGSNGAAVGPPGSVQARPHAGLGGVVVVVCVSLMVSFPPHAATGAPWLGSGVVAPGHLDERNTGDRMTRGAPTRSPAGQARRETYAVRASSPCRWYSSRTQPLSRLASALSPFSDRRRSK